MNRGQFADNRRSWDEQLRIYVKRCAGLYPQGVPKTPLARHLTKGATQLISEEVQVIFITASANLGDPELLLLTSAAERGLKLSAAEYRLITTAELGGSDTLIGAGSSSVRALVLLGQLGESVANTCQLKLSARGRNGPVPIISTFSLSEVVANGTLKRPFWEDLKPILGAV